MNKNLKRIDGSRPIALVMLVAASLAVGGCSLPDPTDPLGLQGDSGGTAQSQNRERVIPSAAGTNGTVASTEKMTGTPLAAELQPTSADAARFLSQASFGPVSLDEIAQVQQYGYEQWLAHQFGLAAPSHMDYIREQAPRTTNGKPYDDMSYEAIWQQWLYSPAQLRARMAFALSEIFVISNIAPDLNPEAMSSYMDMLNRNAFGNYRTLLEDVTLHPAMGYYLNMLESEKEDPAKGTHPNENYAREVLQLFSIGLVQLDINGTAKLDAQDVPIPTYDQAVVGGYAQAFSGWSYGGRDTAKPDEFHGGKENWTVPMQAWASKHSTAQKQLLDNRILPAGQTPQQDMQVALDSIFYHPNVGPFIGRRLIQRLVTSNPSPAYIGRVATVFNDNGAGVRGDLRAVLTAVLLDQEARAPLVQQAPNAGKQREPVIRFANLLRALNVKSKSGHTDIHYLDSGDNALGQSPLLAPSVFNFFSPDFKNPGPIAQAGLNSPEFQITNETTVVGTLNFFARLVFDKGYGSGENRIDLDFGRLADAAADAGALADRVNLLFMNGTMTPATRTSFLRAINAIDPKSTTERIQAALVLTAIAPEFVIQR